MMESTPKVRADVAAAVNLVSKSLPSSQQPGDQGPKPHFPASDRAPHVVSKASPSLQLTSKATPLPKPPEPRPTTAPPGDWGVAGGDLRPDKKVKAHAGPPQERPVPKTAAAKLGPRPPRRPPPSALVAATAAEAEDFAPPSGSRCARALRNILQDARVHCDAYVACMRIHI